MYVTSQIVFDANAVFHAHCRPAKSLDLHLSTHCNLCMHSCSHTNGSHTETLTLHRLHAVIDNGCATALLGVVASVHSAAACISIAHIVALAVKAHAMLAVIRMHDTLPDIHTL